MRRTILPLFLLMTTFIPRAFAYPAVDNLVQKLKPIIQGTDWELSSDWRSVTLVRRRCQFLSPVSLPAPITDDQVWKEYSFVTDYRISITFETKLTDAEYRQQWKLKQQLIAERTKGVARGTKDYAARLAEASKVMRLPLYKSHRFSMYVYSSQDNFFEVRPEGVHQKAHAILQLLGKQFDVYGIRTPNKPNAGDGK